MTRARGRVVAMAVAIACAVAAAVVASCTTFDGAEVPAGVADASSPAPDAGLPPRLDAAPEAPAPPVVGYLSLPDAARACSRVLSCPQLGQSIIESLGVPVGSLNFAECVDWLAGPLPSNRVGVPVQAAAFACVAAATSCIGAGECVALEELGPSDPRCADAGAKDGAPPPERCTDDGGTVLRCSQAYALHCGTSYYAPGSTCLTGADGTHWCSTSTNCTATTSCIGQLLTYCGSGNNLTEGINCSVTGYTCGVDVEAGSPDCLTRTTNVPCAAPGSDCEPDSSVLSVCDGTELSEFDCAGLDGGTCTKMGSGTARCARPRDQCNVFDATVNVCSGTTISLCQEGVRATFDCASIGMTCKPGVGSESGHCG